MNRAKIDFLKKISDYFESLDSVISDKNLCVCLSGGADSVSLLCGMLMVSDKFGFSVSACHFNHMIRGFEADTDEIFCKALCEKLNVKIFCGRDDVPSYAKINKLSLEEAARECRYAFFERIYSKSNVDYCVTAHNMNDDAETLLFNLIRGSGSNGSSSISPYNNSILRPLLKITRSEVEAFLSEINQDFVKDSTNDSIEFTRNYIRHELMPKIEKINPAAVEAFSRYIDACRCDRDYFERIVNDNLNNDLLSLHKSVRDRVIMKNYNLFSGKHLNNAMICELEKALFFHRRVVVPLDSEDEAVVDSGIITFYKKSEECSVDFDEVLLKNNQLFFEDRVKIELYDNKNELCENINKIVITDLLSFDNIVGTLKVRNRRVGDKLFLHGMNKSLKKLFIENKIPKEYRNVIPIIFDDAGIIYVPFVGIADRAYPKNSVNKKYICTVFNTVDKERWKLAYEK